MKCKFCEKEAIFVSEHGPLCRNHFLQYFERKVIRTIQKYKLITPKDKVALAVSGGKDSLSLGYLLSKYRKRRKFDLFFITIDEGFPRRKENIENIKTLAEMWNVPFYVYSFEEEYGKTLMEIWEEWKKRGNKGTACTVCSSLKRRLLNKKARELGATKLAVGHNALDVAETLLINIFQNRLSLIKKQMPISTTIEGFVPRIRPLFFIKEEESRLYAILRNLNPDLKRCPFSTKAYRDEIRRFLAELNSKYPNTISGALRSLLELGKYIPEKEGKIKFCKYCGEPSSQEVCSTCRILEELKKSREERTKEEECQNKDL